MSDHQNNPENLSPINPYSLQSHDPEPSKAPPQDSKNSLKRRLQEQAAKQSRRYAQVDSGTYGATVFGVRLVEDTFGAVNFILSYKLDEHDLVAPESYNPSGRKTEQLKVAFPGFDPAEVDVEEFFKDKDLPCKVKLRRNTKSGPRYKVLAVMPSLENI
jgi:hypothetical protein